MDKLLNGSGVERTCVFHLEMNTCYKTKRQFIDTLAHEIVHLYQMRNAGDSGNHNKTVLFVCSKNEKSMH